MTTPSENPDPYGGDPDGYGSAYGSAYGQQPYSGGPFSPDAQPYGVRSPYGDPPYGAQPYENRPYGNQPYAGQPFGPQSYGAQPYGVHPYGGPGHAAMQPYGPNSYGPHPGASRKEPALSLVLSFFLPGLGTVINGQTGKGIGIMAGYFLGMLLSVVLIGIPIMLGFWVWGMIDGYSGAKEYNARNGLG
ncbi:hypothetical protein [Dietzia sp. PP-33]|jgi:TM2 domain-containing membrane protein YozV|uniref:hypothetical protein n=1 Tax=Dietzia sp. PP-33 TaxID=2957500 RepID=UPI0029B090BF|nr:hypothetical protein [Dietzia sp. PP-33]MDX2356313.1 hypothetical protein [Dietzia sp. PP-33]